MPFSSESSSTSVAKSWGLTNVKIIKLSYMWTINNFSFRGEKTGQILKSPIFSTDEKDKLKWYLTLYPKGKDEESKDFLSLFLRLASCRKKEIRAKFELSILNKREENRAVRRFILQRFVQGGGWGWKKLIRQDFLVNKANELLTDDRLTLCCEICLVADSSNISGQNNPQQFKIPECSLSTDMEELFESQKFSDFVLSLNGRQFFVHKFILASRSRVFAAMFEHEMEEKKHNRVAIADMDADVMQEVLRFIYTGKASGLETMAGELLAAADKYALDRLKGMCEEALSAELSVATAPNILVLADLYSADQLKTHAIDFIVLHATEIMATSGWDTMAIQHPHLINETFRAFANKHTHLEPPRKRAKLA